MDSISALIYWDMDLDCWVVKTEFFETSTLEFKFKAKHGAYLVIYIDNNDGPVPVYRVRTTQHISQHAHQLGFRWVHHSVVFSSDWDVTVDGRQFKPNLV